MLDQEREHKVHFRFAGVWDYSVSTGSKVWPRIFVETICYAIHIIRSL